MQGSRTPPELERRFQEELLACGIPKRAAAKLEIPQSTGYELAKRAWKDPEFVRAWEELRAIDVPTLRALVLEAAEEIQQRIMAPDPSPEDLAQIAVANGLKSFSYQNPKAQYFRGLVQAFEAIAKPRDELQASDSGGPAVVINEAPAEQKPGDE